MKWKNYAVNLTTGGRVFIGPFLSIESAKEYADLAYSTMVVEVVVDLHPVSKEFI